MGTDRVKLFNKALADRILAMDRRQLTGFLEENIGLLNQKAFTPNAVLCEMEQGGGTVAVAVEALLAGEYTLAGLKTEVASDFASGDEEIFLDYWGCYAHVFAGHPEGSISSLDYLPGEQEETFLLLRPDHVDRMIRSLREHADDLSVMSGGEVEKLERWRDQCAANPDYMAAYVFDF